MMSIPLLLLQGLQIMKVMEELKHGFEDHEDNIQVFLIEMNRKQINIPKVLRFSWLRAEG